MKVFSGGGVDRHTQDNQRRWVLIRASLAFLGLNAASLGLWATFAPRSWFESFPGMGRSWIGLDGPYNQHLAGDVGALSLALAVVTLAALSSRSQAMVRAVGLAWLVSALPHLLYHLGNRGHLPTADQRASLGGLALQVVLAAFCVLAVPSSPVPASTEPMPVISAGVRSTPDRRSAV